MGPKKTSKILLRSTVPYRYIKPTFPNIFFFFNGVFKKICSRSSGTNVL